jgi:hypothetical protein
VITNARDSYIRPQSAIAKIAADIVFILLLLLESKDGRCDQSKPPALAQKISF